MREDYEPDSPEDEEQYPQDEEYEWEFDPDTLRELAEEQAWLDDEALLYPIHLED